MNKKLLTVAIASALAAPMAAQAIDFKVSGHVNRMIRYADDGVGSDVQHMDNGASMTRIRFVGSGDLGNGMKVGTNIETAVASNQSGNQALKTGDGGDTTFNIRHSALWFSGDWGKVTMGHTSEASDGTTTVDMSRTWMADVATSAWNAANAIIWRTSANAQLTATNTAVCGTAACTVGGAFNTFDGGRRDVLRYDSPALGPATIAASVSNNEIWTLGLSMGGDLAGGSYALKAGYGNYDNNSGQSTWGVSGGFKFSQGTSITLQYAAQDKVAASSAISKNGDRFFAKLAHDWGNNGVSISYSETNDVMVAGSQLTTWGIGFNHAFPKAGVDVYAGFHNHSLDLPAANAGGFNSTSVQDVNVVTVGTRVKFN